MQEQHHQLSNNVISKFAYLISLFCHVVHFVGLALLAAVLAAVLEATCHVIAANVR